MTAHFDPLRGLPIVDALLRGPVQAVRVHLLIDTGSALTMLRPSSLAAAGHELARPRSTVRIAGVNSTLETPLFVVEGLSALGLDWTNCAVLSHALSAGLPFTGLIGANLLRNRRLAIDYRTGLIDLE